jgi:hypothetical protein
LSLESSLSGFSPLALAPARRNEKTITTKTAIIPITNHDVSLIRLYQKPFLGSAMARVLADFMIMSIVCLSGLFLTPRSAAREKGDSMKKPDVDAGRLERDC